MIGDEPINCCPTSTSAAKPNLKCVIFINRRLSSNNTFKIFKILKVSDLYQFYLEKFLYMYYADILSSSFDNCFFKTAQHS